MFQKIKIFISSVQSEFAQERAELIEYINGDSLLGRYFDPFIFEQLPAANISAEQAYLSQVSFSEIYIGILGENYGSENEQGISPTELEYNKATALHKTRLIYLKDTEEPRIHPKLSKFIKKVQNEVVRKKFYALNDLKTQVYKSLIHYLEYKELIVTVPFDASDSNLTLHDIDEDRIAWFMQIARSKRGLPQKIGNSTRELLIHLHLLDNEKLSKAAILLFGKDPQKLVIQSEVRCAHFHGKIVEKPIPSYKVFKGDIFQLIDEAVDFVLSKLDYKIETRALTNAIPGSYEIPRAIVSEAIVNAIAHRDYTSKGSVQVMLFEDRLEIWNPGQLPMGWGISKLKEPHGSVPYNPLIADALYLAGYIERMGTGTSDIYRLAAFNGLAEPKFIQAEEFKTIIYKPDYLSLTEDSNQPTDQVITEEVRRILILLVEDRKRQELMDMLDLRHRLNFMDNYINPAMSRGLIELTEPNTPNHPNQRYRLTNLGKKIYEAEMSGKKKKRNKK